MKNLCFRLAALALCLCLVAAPFGEAYGQAAEAPPRFIFTTYEGDLRKLAGMTFGVMTNDARHRVDFLLLGDIVPGTKFKLARFIFKSQPDPKTGAAHDRSELTLVHAETRESIVLVISEAGGN
jgi:hypothetical protein